MKSAILFYFLNNLTESRALQRMVEIRESSSLIKNKLSNPTDMEIVVRRERNTTELKKRKRMRNVRGRLKVG